MADTKTTIGFSLFGHGPSKVIALNDWTADSSSYDTIKPYLAEEDLEIAFADLRGYGSSKNIEGDYSLAEISNDVLSLADHLGWERFSLLGHSMGGMAVQRVMIDAAGRVDRVVAATPVTAAGFPVDDETFAFFESMASNDEAFLTGADMLTGGRYGKEWATFKLKLNRSTVLPVAMAAYTEMWIRSDFSEEASGNETPILVIFGEFDNEGLVEAATGPFFQATYPNLQTHVCASGHYPMQETTVDFANAIQRFFSS